MKAILVIDMPNNCMECPLFREEFALCPNIEKPLDEGKPDWCPLRPLPLKETIKNEDEFMETYGWMQEATTGMDIGWNACLDEITGETE